MNWHPRRRKTDAWYTRTTVTEAALLAIAGVLAWVLIVEPVPVWLAMEAAVRLASECLR